MNTDRNPRNGQVPLPGFAESTSAAGRAPFPGPGEAVPNMRTAPARRDGIRRVRRMSNWTAAALVVGTGATTLALAHHAFPISAPTASAASATTGVGTTAVTNGTSGPQVSHSVATTSGSGVVVTTTSHVVNGKTVVSQVRHAPAYHDN
jgi:hypothetical protein